MLNDIMVDAYKDNVAQIERVHGAIGAYLGAQESIYLPHDLTSEDCAAAAELAAFLTDSVNNLLYIRYIRELDKINK